MAASFGMTCLWWSRELKKGVCFVLILGFEAVPQSPHVKKADNLSAMPLLRVSVNMETAVDISMTFRVIAVLVRITSPQSGGLR